MNKDLALIFAQGFTFIGDPSGHSTVPTLKKAVRIDTVNTMSQEGIVPISMMKEVGDLEFYGGYVRGSVDSSLFRDYVKLTTGIEIPDIKVSY